MIVEVMRWRIVIDFVGFPNWTEFRYVVAYVDDSDYSIFVRIRDGSDNPVELPTSGPSSLFLGTNGMVNLITAPPYYQYCDTTTLRKIGIINSFPYVAFGDHLNDSQCQIAPVCDLEMTSTYTVENTTDPDTADGEIQVSATSSNGVIKFAIGDFDYTTGTNVSGLFTGLYPGTYRIYAKDEIGCQDTIDITITVTTLYGIRYRGDYKTVGSSVNNDTRIDILQRGYEDSTTAICFSGRPFVLDYDECDKYTPFVASHCTMELLEEVENDFLDLFTNDDRKYKVNYYKNFGSGYVLIWAGYVIPEFYQKPFVMNKNNYITVKASDQIGQLKEELFVDSSENDFRGELSQLEIITQILEKTGLELNLRIQDNIFEESMDTDFSPLAQAFVDVRIFEEKKCDEVLEHTVKCKSGLRLFQSRGYWWLVRSEYNAGQFDYYEYTFAGVFVEISSYNPVVTRVTPINETGLFWANASQLELFETNYGKFTLTHILGFDDNLIDEGRFEEDDIVDLGNGNKTFKNWSVSIGQPGVKYGLEFVDNGESEGALFVDLESAGGIQIDTTVYSKEITLESNSYGSANLIKFKFQYSGLPFYKIPWIRLAWELRYTSNLGGSEYFLRDTGLPNAFSPWTSDVNKRKNDIYIDKYNSFQTLELTVPVIDIYGGTIRIAFYMHNHAGRDFSSLDSLAAEPTSDFFVGNTTFIGQRLLVYNAVADGGDDFTYFYELEEGTDADNRPEVVRPDDYEAPGGATPNPKVWRKKGSFFAGGSALTGLVDKVLLDNVQLTYIPFDPFTALNYQPPKTKSYGITNNKFNKANFSEEFLLGDLPVLNTTPPQPIENSRDLYRGYLRLEDGTPTDAWFRNGVNESEKLLALALIDRVEQLKNIQRRLQVDVHQRGVYYAFVDSLSYDSRRFLNAKYVLDDKQNIINLEAVQMTTGADGEPPIETGAFSDAYADDFDN